MSPSPSLLSISSPGSMEVVGGSIARVDSRGWIGISDFQIFFEIIEIASTMIFENNYFLKNERRPYGIFLKISL